MVWQPIIKPHKRAKRVVITSRCEVLGVCQDKAPKCPKCPIKIIGNN
jgi:hypothetical protein